MEGLSKGQRVRIVGSSSVAGHVGTVIRIDPSALLVDDLCVTVRLDNPKFQSDSPDWVMRRSELEAVSS